MRYVVVVPPSRPNTAETRRRACAFLYFHLGLILFCFGFFLPPVPVIDRSRLARSVRFSARISEIFLFSVPRRVLCARIESRYYLIIINYI